jgi:lysophospholipase L1-like esterase
MLGASAVALSGGQGSVCVSPRRAGNKPPPALLDADFVAKRFSISGAPVATEAAFLAALGGSVAAGGYRFGPHVAHDAPELLTNGDFSAGTTGWQTSGTASLTVAGGVGVLSGGGANSPVVAQPIGAHAGSSKAYRFKGRYARGTQNNSVTIGVFNSSGGAPDAFGQSNAAPGQIMVEGAVHCGGVPQGGLFGGKSYGNPMTGTALFQAMSMKEAVPFPGFVAGGVRVMVTARTPASASGVQILWQADDAASNLGNPLERNFVRLIHDSAQRLRLVVSSGATGTAVEQANLDLGVVPPAAVFTVAFSASANAFIASLDGRQAIADMSGQMPGLAAMRIGHGATGNVWTGDVLRVIVHAGPGSVFEVENLACAPARLVAAWGDSLTAGAGATGTGYPLVAANLFTPPRAVANMGIGGQSSTQIAARMNARPISVSVAGDTIPASGPVAVTDKSINILTASGAFVGSQVGSLAGVAGVMTTDAAGNWTFTRTSDGTPVTCPPATRFITRLGESLRPRTHWLWLGRNSVQSGFSVEDDIAAVAAHLGYGRFLVGSILPSVGDSASAIAAIAARNANLASAYGQRFIDLLAVLHAAGDGSSGDAADIAAGLTPRSLRTDDVHLNDAGYALVAAAFTRAHGAMGW